MNKVLQTPWYTRITEALQLNGKSETTQRAYARAVRMLIEFAGKEPDLITEEELKDYFLHRKNVDKWSHNTMRICYGGLRFFYEHVIKRDWHILNILRAQPEHRLPAILSGGGFRPTQSGAPLSQLRFPCHGLLVRLAPQ